MSAFHGERLLKKGNKVATPCGNTRIEYKNNSGLLKPKTEFRFN